MVILILGECINGEAAYALQRFAPPGADRPGNDRNAPKCRQRPTFKILARNIFKCLPARDYVRAISDLGIAGDRTNRRVLKPTHKI
jgi:hypothetical protein